MKRNMLHRLVAMAAAGTMLMSKKRIKSKKN